MEEMMNVDEVVTNGVDAGELISNNENGLSWKDLCIGGGIAAAGFIVGRTIEWGAKKLAPAVKRSFKKIFKKSKKEAAAPVVAEDDEIDLHKDQFPEFND